MSAQTLEDRLVALVALQARVDAEVDRVRATIRNGRTRVRRRSIDPPPPCGTEEAFQWHKYRKQPVDERCLAAHATYERARTRARGAA